MARVIADAAEQIAEDEANVESMEGTPLMPMISTGAQMLGLLSQLREAADHLEQHTQMTKKATAGAQSDPNAGQFNPGVDSSLRTGDKAKEEAPGLLAQAVEKYSLEAEKKFQESVSRVNKMFDDALGSCTTVQTPVQNVGSTDEIPEESKKDTYRSHKNTNEGKTQALDQEATPRDRIAGPRETALDVVNAESRKTQEAEVSASPPQVHSSEDSTMRAQQLHRKQGKKFRTPGKKSRPRRKKSKISQIISEQNATPSMAIMRPSTASRELRGTRLEYLELIGRGTSSKVYWSSWNASRRQQRRMFLI